MQSMFHGVREYLTPVLTDSAFEEKGLLTPEEFVKAGDLLVYKCPTWRWERGDPSSRRPYLPEDKQYLVTRNVPCRRRVTALEHTYQEEEAVEGEDEWIAATSYATDKFASTTSEDALSNEIGHISLSSSPRAALPDANATNSSVNAPPPSSSSILDALVDRHFEPQDSRDGPPDLSSFEDENLLVEDAEGPDAATLPAPEYLVASEPEDDDDAILYTRTYDLSMTYDKYYQTPRVWLFGYDERNAPLSATAMFEDIMQDYANRTVTMEAHPHRPGVVHASIHPCQHGAVMKRIVANLKAPGAPVAPGTATAEIRSDQYLFLFLKFIQSVIPTIDYDHTIEVTAAASSHT